MTYTLQWCIFFDSNINSEYAISVLFMLLIYRICLFLESCDPKTIQYTQKSVY